MKTLELEPSPPIILDNHIRFNCHVIRRYDRGTENILDRCATFDSHLDIKRVSKLVVLDGSTRAFVKETLRALEKARVIKDYIRPCAKYCIVLDVGRVPSGGCSIRGAN